MTLETAEWTRLEHKAHQLRELTLDTVVWAGSGHIGGALSAMDILTVLYHHTMHYSADLVDNPERDRFVLSKGHIGVGFAPVLADLGCFPLDWLKEYNHTGSPLGMHPDASKVPGVEVSTGSLGHGLPMALGMALGARTLGQEWTTHCLLGDGECNEGSVWEAAMAASQFGAGSLVAIVDRNHAMIDGLTEDVMGLEPFAAKWEAFGWHTAQVNGHHIPSLVAALDAARAETDHPSVLICDTVKGEGIEWIEGDYAWHYGSFDENKAQQARESLARHAERRIAAIKED